MDWAESTTTTNPEQLSFTSIETIAYISQICIIAKSSPSAFGIVFVSVIAFWLLQLKETYDAICQPLSWLI